MRKKGQNFSKKTKKSAKKSTHMSSTNGEQEEKDRHKETSPFLKGGRVTLYGRKPVLEALNNPRLTPQKLFLAHRVQGDLIQEIKRAAH